MTKNLKAKVVGVEALSRAPVIAQTNHYIWRQAMDAVIVHDLGSLQIQLLERLGQTTHRGFLSERLGPVY